MILLVCGGRDYMDCARVFHALDAAHARRPIQRLIAGCAAGTDALAHEWAEARGVASTVYTANWRDFGKAAGPMRNQRMLEHGKPDAAVAFPGGAGTADMCRRLTAAGVPLWRPYGVNAS